MSKETLFDTDYWSGARLVSSLIVSKSVYKIEDHSFILGKQKGKTQLVHLK